MGDDDPKPTVPEAIERDVPEAEGAAGGALKVEERAAPQHAGEIIVKLKIFPRVLRLVGVRKLQLEL
jgi:hypothetical protein